MRVLVLGGEGMLGHKIYQTLLKIIGSDSVACTIHGDRSVPFYKAIELFATGEVIENVDVIDFEGLERVLRQRRPAFIINCVGIIKQRDGANAAIPSITINALLPHKLAAWARAWGGRIIHFSTDCVFSGKRGGYQEGDASDAEDLYGRTKYLGEVATENALTLRTSIIGRELSQYKSLLEWFLSQRGQTIQGYRQAIYSGVTTNYMAQLVSRIITERPDLHGLYQVTSTPISKLDLLTKLRDAYQMDVIINPDDSEACDRSMCGGRFASTTGFVTPSWDELVSQLATDATPYHQWRLKTGA